MKKIYNHEGKVICLADPETGFIEIKTKNFVQRQTLLPGMSVYYDSDDGYTTVVEFVKPNEMYQYTRRSF